MEGLVVLGVVIGALGLLAVLAVVFGVDSREDSTDPRSPDHSLTA